MLTRLARRTLLLMALAMGISLFVPNINWTEETVRMAAPSTEEEAHTLHGLLCVDTQVSWRYAAYRLGSVNAAMASAQGAALPDGPVHEVSVPPPRTGTGSFRC